MYVTKSLAVSLMGTAVPPVCEHGWAKSHGVLDRDQVDAGAVAVDVGRFGRSTRRERG
jgi:hypothetical protein